MFDCNCLKGGFPSQGRKRNFRPGFVVFGKELVKYLALNASQVLMDKEKPWRLPSSLPASPWGLPAALQLPSGTAFALLPV